MDVAGERRRTQRSARIDIEIKVAGRGDVRIKGLRQLHVDRTVSGNRQFLVAHQLRGAANGEVGFRAGDVHLGQAKVFVVQRCPQRFRGLQRDALKGNGELVDLRVSAEQLWLPQRAGEVDGPGDRRIAGDTLHMKGAQHGSDIEIGQDQVGLGFKVAIQSCLAFDLQPRQCQAVLGGEISDFSLGVHDRFQGSRGLTPSTRLRR